MAAHRDMVERGIDVHWKKQYKHYGGHPSGESPGSFYKKPSSDCEFQDSGQINKKDSLGNPRRQHLRHGFRVHEMSDAGKNEQDIKSDPGSAPRIVVTLRDD